MLEFLLQKHCLIEKNSHFNEYNVERLKIIWKNLCEQHLQTNCLETQLTNPDLRLFKIPEKEEIYKNLTKSYFYGVHPEAQMLLKEALIENSLVNLFIEISEDCVKKENFEHVWLEQYQHYKRRHSQITFLFGQMTF